MRHKKVFPLLPPPCYERGAGRSPRESVRRAPSRVSSRLTRLLSVVLDDDARAADDLSGVAVPVDLAEPGPGAEDLWVGDLDEVDLVLGAEGLDELGVLGLGARLVEDAEVGLALVESLGALAEASGQTVVDLRGWGGIA